MSNYSLLKQFTKYVSLSIMGTLAQSLYIIADTVFIAQGIGADAVAALNIALPVFGIIFGFGMMIGIGGGTRSSIYEETKSEVFTLCIISAAVISGVFSVLGLFFADKIAVLFGAGEDIMELTVTYLRIALIFAPAFMLNNSVVCFVRNDKNPHLSSIAMLTSSFSNIVLDYIFIFPLGLGMLGAILATVMSPIISLAVLSLHFILKKNTFRFTLKGFKFSFRELFNVCSLGFSSFINEVANAVVVMVFNFIILSLSGTVGISAYGIIANFSLMIINIFAGIAQGIQPLTSRAYGKGLNKDASRIYMYGIMLSAAIGIIVYILSYFNTEALISIFNRDNDLNLLSIASRGIRLYFIGFVFAGASIISSTYFSSIERPVSAFIPSALRGFALIIPMAYLMSFIFKMDGVWLSFTVTEFIVMIVCFFLIGAKNIRSKT